MALDSSSTSPPVLHYQHGADHYPRKLPKPDVVPSGITERKTGPSDKPDMVAVDIIDLREPDFPVHRKKLDSDTYVLGTIHPFRKSQRSFLGKLTRELLLVASDRRSWKILLFLGLNIVCIGCLIMWGKSTNSMALTAYTCLSIFHLFSLITCLISSWVTMKKPSAAYAFGFERFEVLAVFATTILVQLGALFILKESFERFLEQPEVHTGRLLVGTFVALLFNLLTLLCVRNRAFACVSEAASSSCLQEHVADLTRSVCGLVPGLSSVLLPRMNPFFLLNMAGALSLCVTYALIEMDDYSSVDTTSAAAIALMTLGTMYPMSAYSGKVLLQTTPSHVIGQLDKLLREVSTLDGVLEVRNEHFWTVGFRTLAGSVHVRIRRDASEQMVLAHVTSRLHALVAMLTVQIFKDDWIRPSLPPTDRRTTTPPPRHARELDVLTSTPAKPGPPPEFSFHTPAKPGSPPEFSFHTPGRLAAPLLLPGPPYRPQSLGLEYRPAPHSSAPGPAWARPHAGRLLAPAYRTAYGPPPQRYGTHAPPGQFSQYRS